MFDQILSNFGTSLCIFSEAFNEAKQRMMEARDNLKTHYIETLKANQYDSD